MTSSASHETWLQNVVACYQERVPLYGEFAGKLRGLLDNEGELTEALLDQWLEQTVASPV